MSLKVIGTGTVRKLGNGFLFAFHMDLVLFLRQSEILVDNRDFFIPQHSTLPLRGLRRNIAIPFGV